MDEMDAIKGLSDEKFAAFQRAVVAKASAIDDRGNEVLERIETLQTEVASARSDMAQLRTELEAIHDLVRATNEEARRRGLRP